jgi:sensor histidine kinase YesM
MIIGRPGERAWGRGLLVALLLWTPLEVPSAAAAIQRVGRGGWVQLAPPVGSIALMGVLTVFTWWTVERWPVAGERARPAHYALHSGLMLAQTLVFVALVRYPIDWSGGIQGPLGESLVAWLPSMVLGYLFNAAIGSFFALRERLLAEESRSARLAAQLTQSQLSVLRAQLHPHFFFNTLNAIAELVHRDADAAGRIVARLGAFLRYSLEMSEREAVPLREEIAALQAYLDIVHLRFGDRVTVETQIEPAALSASVPPLLVQPLVENALKHGLEGREGPGRLEISARIRERMLHLEVRDDGVGLSAERRPGAGIGLRNTRDRLEQMYGAAATLTVEPRPTGGVAATVVLPAEG